MRLIDADRLLEDKRIETYYHLKNGDIAIPLIDIKHAPTVEERTGTHACDVISRQQAIDAMGIEPFAFGEYENGLHDKWEDDVEALMNLPSAQPEQSIAQERYEDLCEYFKDCSDQGRSILNDRKEFKSWLDRMKWHVVECDKLGRELEELKSAQPERKKGEWLGEDDAPVAMKNGCPVSSCYCSECGEWLTASDEYYVRGNFCPNCGSDNRGENR